MTKSFGNKIFPLTFLLVAFTSIGSLFGQSSKMVKLIHADNIFYDKELIEAQRLIGNVQLEYESTLFFCDSAYLYANQNFDAFGKIRVNKGADYNVTGDKLFFDQSKKTARLNNHGILRDREMTLTSDNILYNLDSEIASYSGGGKIISNTNNNVLNSREGYYHSKSQTFFFRNKVVLVNPQYTVKSDTLQYGNASEIAYFFGPTTIDSDDTHIYCENGWYDTKKDICQFNRNASVTSKTTVLKGDSIYYNGKKGIGEVFRNVSIRDTTSNYLITGEYGRHNEKTKESMVTQRALMTQVFEEDSLFLHADTLIAISDSLEKKTIFAFHGVRIFKNDLQGISDSLAYSEADSTIRFFGKPVLWNEANQITGDSISIRTWQGHIEKLFVRGNSFIISEAGSTVDSIQTNALRYNQIKGRNTTGFFEENNLTHIRVEGNGQLVYFPSDDKNGTPKIIGHNKGECSDIEIGIKENKINRIKLITEPNSTFSPMKLTEQSELLLEGFVWRGNERPLSKKEVFGPIAEEPKVSE